MYVFFFAYMVHTRMRIVKKLEALSDSQLVVALAQLDKQTREDLKPYIDARLKQRKRKN